MIRFPNHLARTALSAAAAIVVCAPALAQNTTAAVNGRITGADGMKADMSGNIWTSSNLGISVFNPAGKRLGIINVGAGRHSNCVFGEDGQKYQ